jgi:hypothetical protein
MELADKLQLHPGQGLVLVGAPEQLPSGLPTARAPAREPEEAALLVFVLDHADLELRRPMLVEAAAQDRLTWLAYPKAGKLGTDLNRDRIAEGFVGSSVRPVRQVALDEIWSALRFRPS